MRPMGEKEPILSIWLDIFWKHKWLVMVFAGLVLASTAVYTRRQTPIYKASTQVVIDLVAPQYLARGGTEVVTLGSGNTWNTSEFFETQYRIIRSRKVAEQVVREQGLAQDLDFLGVNRIEDAELRARRLEKVDPVRLLAERVTVEAVANSHVVLVEVKDTDPQRAARLADAVARAYEQQNVDRKVSAASDAVAWLEAQAKILEGELRTAETELLAFKRTHDIVGASLGDKQNLVALDLQEAKKLLREAQLEAGRLRSQTEQIKRLSPEEAANSIEAVLENGLIQRLKEQKVALENERDDLLKRYLESHPDVRASREKSTRVAAALRSEVQGVAKSLERNHQAAARVEQKLTEEVRGIEAKAREMQGRELEYKRLEGLADSKKEVYSNLLIRLKEAELQADARANNVRILDEALVPEVPVSPRMVLNLAVAGVLALLGGFGLAFLLEQLDSSVKTQEQLERDYGLTFLGIIPSIRSIKGSSRFEGKGSGNPDRYIIDNPNSTAAECVRTIRTNLLFMSPDREMRSILVTSAGPREGKTYTCTNIAATMAQAGSRVLLVDSDLRRPRVHKVFDMHNERGLTDLIRDPDRAIGPLTQDPGLPNLTVMTTGPLPPNPSELLQTASFRKALDRLLENYDRVVFDSPPVVAVTDAQLLGRQVDGAVLVVRAGQTNRDMLAKAVRLLTDVNVRIFGALLNSLDVNRRGYGQMYYRYYRQHGAYGAAEPEDQV